MAEQLCVPLYIIFNLNLNTSTLPDSGKMQLFARSTGNLNKKETQQTTGHYKTLERVIVEQIVEHNKISHLDCEPQHGFTTGNSINTTLLEALNVWTEFLMHNIPIDVIYLDFAKAFDPVPHQRLLKQVEHLGIKDKALGWIPG